MTKVKICGITNLEDALLSAHLGADLLGFNFYEMSPRYIMLEAAREIIAQLPDHVVKVGVFVNESLENIVETADAAGLDAVQLHGDESPAFACDAKVKTGLETIKVFRVSPEFKPSDVLAYDAGAILLDAFSNDGYGGTGETFNWDIAKKVRDLFPSIYLAGGLNANNVAAAIDAVRPYAVDVASGVESAKGKKDPVKVEAFIRNARTAL